MLRNSSYRIRSEAAGNNECPRIRPDGVSVEINRGTWPELPIFGLMQRLGNVGDREMFRTFNMGIGMVVICSESDKTAVAERIDVYYEMGRITTGSGNVEILPAF
jgi:phosphoribosylformylglycinamidine cyclo-ligase